MISHQSPWTRQELVSLSAVTLILKRITIMITTTTKTTIIIITTTIARVPLSSDSKGPDNSQCCPRSTNLVVRATCMTLPDGLNTRRDHEGLNSRSHSIAYTCELYAVANVPGTWQVLTFPAALLELHN
jgi:hypothetical protein